MEDIYKNLKTLFMRTNSRFIYKERSLFFSEISERSLCGALQCHLKSSLQRTGFRAYHVDVEYNRNMEGKIKTIVNTDQGSDLVIIPITCDLIVHSRGENTRQDNLLCLEMKKSSRPKKEKEEDKLRLRCLTKTSYDGIWSADGIHLPEHVCNYVIGIYYEIKFSTREIMLEFYALGELRETETISF